MISFIDFLKVIPLLIMLASCNSNEVTDFDYNELYRGQYHFSTPEGNLADPNGLIYYEDEYHLFHQQDGNWAHAISSDLLHWEHQPVALEHDELGQAMSGSTVIDENNTSGLFEDEGGIVAFYTNTEGGEAQSIAYSEDNGRTWERYDGNPVIHNSGEEDFRDPGVFWHDDTGKWVMVVSRNDAIVFYNSDNLIDWEYTSEFKEQGLQVAVWETPELFKLPLGDEEKWVLHVSVGDNPETEGSTAQYFIGDFNGETFERAEGENEINITDSGQDFYAAQTFSNIEDRTVWLAWMDNWAYPYSAPTPGWQGSMSFPRELTLSHENDEYTLIQQPIEEISLLREEGFTFENIHVQNDTIPIDFNGTQYEFIADIEWGEDIEEFAINLRVGDEEYTAVGVDVLHEKVFLDRTHNGLDEIENVEGDLIDFSKRFETEHDVSSKKVRLRGLVDESSVELFVDDGSTVFSNLIYPEKDSDGIEIYSEGGIHINKLRIYPLKSIWR